MKPSLWRRIKRAYRYPFFVRPTYAKIIALDEAHAASFEVRAKFHKQNGDDITSQWCESVVARTRDNANFYRREVFLEDV